MIKLFAIPILIVVIIVSVSFCIGWLFGYSRAVNEVMPYTIERTICEIAKIFDKHGMKDIFDRLIKEETELKSKEYGKKG